MAGAPVHRRERDDRLELITLMSIVLFTIGGLCEEISLESLLASPVEAIFILSDDQLLT